MYEYTNVFNIHLNCCEPYVSKSTFHTSELESKFEVQDSKTKLYLLFKRIYQSRHPIRDNVIEDQKYVSIISTCGVIIILGVIIIQLRLKPNATS